VVKFVLGFSEINIVENSVFFLAVNKTDNRCLLFNEVVY